LLTLESPYLKETREIGPDAQQIEKMDLRGHPCLYRYLVYKMLGSSFSFPIQGLRQGTLRASADHPEEGCGAVHTGIVYPLDLMF